MFDMHDGAEHNKDGCSYSNELECQLIMKICSLLLEVKTSASIGIITPYRAQAKMIQTSIKSRYIKYDYSDIHGCTTLVVHVAHDRIK